MKIDKLTLLKKALVSEFSQQNIKCAIHFKNVEQWTELEGGIATSSIALGLEKAKNEPIAYHTTNSKTARYYLAEYDAVISLTSSKSPRIETRKKNRVTIEKIQEGASNAYRVSHHSLTHLLAKEAFRDSLKNLIGEINGTSPSDSETQEIEQPNILAVMALDIDYFKQVNDTWGHLYGDQVLKTFGRRLERCAQIIKENSPLASIHLGHPSGEEFLICMTAHATKEQFSIWANKFRSCICDEVLPTDKEWSWLSTSDNLSALMPPPVTDRGISTSIGIVLHTSIALTDTTEDPTTRLLDLADTALYRAKAAGRNQVIFYDEILSSCGRVIEQDLKTGVIALDIGSNVGVNIGQEFKVYHPSFTGKRKFFINDGRTTRTLGLYPKVESGRIIVFNTQPEISFAYIDTLDNTKQELEIGSHLEAIPAGSIGHLLPNTSRYASYEADFLKSANINTLQEFITSHASSNDSPFAAVIRFTREAEYTKKYGTAALNKALASLYRGAQISFPHAATIVVLDSGSICIVGSNNSYSESALEGFMKGFTNEYPTLEASAGVFCADDLLKAREINNIELSPLNAIELATFSASKLAAEKNSTVCHFSLTVAIRALEGSRRAQAFDVAYADFKRLIKLGVDAAPIYNIGGLSAGRIGLDQEALEHYKVAISKSPTKIVYKTNYAIITLKIGSIDQGLEMLSALTDQDIIKLEKLHPSGYFAYAHLLAKAKLSGSLFFDNKRFSKIALRAIAIPEAEHLKDSIKEIKTALEQ